MMSNPPESTLVFMADDDFQPSSHEIRNHATDELDPLSNSVDLDEYFIKEVNDLDEYDEDDDEDSGESPQSFDGSTTPLPGNIQTEDEIISLHRKLTKDDANSIVGGEQYNQFESPIERISSPSEPVLGSSPIDIGIPSPRKGNKSSTPLSHSQSANTPSTTLSRFLSSSGPSSQKVFSFSLPFGGSFSSLYKQIGTHIPLIRSSSMENDEGYQIKLKLERHQSLSTIEEAKYFERHKGADDSRLRAVKHSLASTLLPDFINSNSVLTPPTVAKDYETIFNRIDGNIVILGGYRGSILRDTKTNKTVWIPIKAGFNLRKINLLLGPTREDEINAAKYIYPDGILKNIGPIDICKKLLKRLSSNSKTNVKEFGYDWRLSGDLISKQLEKFLQDIYDKTGKPTIVIGHSMGGLMAHGALQRNPKLFRGLLYVGTPSECLNILGPIRFGDSVILSDKILTFESNFMMRSSFNFLPLSGRVFFDKDTNEPYDLDLFDPDTWVEYNLNPLVAKKRKLLEESTINLSESISNTGFSSPTSNSFSLAASSYTLQPSISNDLLQFPSISSISNKIKNYRPLSKKKTNDDNSGSLNSPPFQRGGDFLAAYASKNRSSSLTSSSPTLSDSENTLSKSLSTELLLDSSGSGNNEIQHYSFTFSDAYNYLKETLEATKDYILSMNYREELNDEYPPMAVVYGNSVPSVRGSKVKGIQDIKDGNYYEFFYGHGDGVVHQRWLMPEGKGFNYFDPESGNGHIVGKFPSDCGHVSLMTDFKAMGQGLNAIYEADKIWKYRNGKKKGMFANQRVSD
ncbi:hypothetical protein DFJ63DRAFT_60145 [Scheffersomyces coipomensis]|uniref:uncharacterized protein n=1 Tax=Scheffersomyces coipomensis TaxID=1788519 RepID=UPI00315D2EFA